MSDLLAVLDEADCWCRRPVEECQEAGGCRWTDEHGRLTRRIRVLEGDLTYWKRQAGDLQETLDAQVSEERDRIMRDGARRFDRGQMTSTWVAATRKIPQPADSGAVGGLLHHRDPACPPKIVPPTTAQRARYLTGEVRDAGPGSHIGVALCGLPLMCDELWIRADHILKAAAEGGSGDAALCGLCSYLAGTPTIEAAWQAVSRDA